MYVLQLRHEVPLKNVPEGQVAKQNILRYMAYVPISTISLTYLPLKLKEKEDVVFEK